MEGTSETPDVKPEKKLGDHMSLKVKSQDGNEICFSIRKKTKLAKLMKAYCERVSVAADSIAFLFEGKRIREDQTPEELNLEDGDEIDAMLHQTGGGSFFI